MQLGVFPAASRLSSLAKLSENAAKVGDGVKLVKAVDVTPTVVVVPGIPALPKKLAQKILNREYVDFTQLPPAKGRAKPTSLDWEGQVLLVQSMDLYVSKKLIPDLATWVQCLYMWQYYASIHQKGCQTC